MKDRKAEWEEFYHLHRKGVMSLRDVAQRMGIMVAEVERKFSIWDMIKMYERGNK